MVNDYSFNLPIAGSDSILSKIEEKRNNIRT
jgi:hypothetical protein